MMNSFRNQQYPAENESRRRFSDVPSQFKRRQFKDWNCLFPRRYVLSLMLFILLMIQAWREINVLFTLAHVIVLGEEAATIRYSSIGHWTIKELDNYKTAAVVADVFAQMPGALLIFIFSSHKFLLVAVSAASFLHMLTPVALNHHSISLLFVLMGQSIIGVNSHRRINANFISDSFKSKLIKDGLKLGTVIGISVVGANAPIYVAVMTTWKDWAPPAERTKLVFFSLYGLFIGTAASTFYPFIFHYVTTDASYYLSGIAGIIWVLFWFNITSDTPENDPLISEEEIIYLENNIPSDHLHKIKVKDIPWKSILISKPVLVLCLIFFKMGCSISTIIISGTIFSFHLGETYNPLYFFIPFVSSFGILILSSAILADFLIKKFSGKTLLIRKIFLCGGFFLQCIFMFGILANSDYTETIFYMVSYTIFAMSVPGFITIALDLSPRYVSIISAICFTFYTLGIICTEYFIEGTIHLLHVTSISWLFLFDGGLSLLSIIFFAMWGDAEEQLWSLTFPTNRKTNDYRSYPKPEDEDDLNLVP